MELVKASPESFRGCKPEQNPLAASSQEMLRKSNYIGSWKKSIPNTAPGSEYSRTAASVAEGCVRIGSFQLTPAQRHGVEAR